MRRALLPLLLLAAPALAADGAATLHPGDAARGDLLPGETDRICLDGVAGVRLSLDLRAGFAPALSILDPAGLPLDPGNRLKAKGRRARLRPLALPATGKYQIVIQTAGGEGGSYRLETRALRPAPVRASGGGAPGAEADVPLGDLPGGSTVRLRAGAGTLSGLSGPGGTIPLGGGRRASAVLPSTGAWSAVVVPLGSRPVRVVASAALPPAASVEREVLDAAPAVPADPSDVVGRTVLVRFREGVDGEAFDGRHGCDSREGVAGTGYVRVDVPDGMAVEDFLDEVGLDADVVEGEPILLSETPEGEQSNVPFTASDAAKADVLQQESFALAGVLQAQGIADGTGVIVAVLDTGVLPGHPDLAGRLLPGFDLVDGDADPTDAGNGLDDDGDGLVDEGVGHGTFVAGLVAAIAPGASILPVRVLDGDARGTSERVAEGIVRAVDGGAKVLNLSLGVRRQAGVLQDAIDYAKSRDVLVVASSGNATLTTGVAYPSSLSEVLTVAAVDATGVRAPFANVSSRVDLVAPGVQVLAPFGASGYALWSGTSFAAPFASAGAAMVLSRNPGMRPRDAGKVLADTAVPVDALNPGVAGSLGSGRLDLPAAVRSR